MLTAQEIVDYVGYERVAEAIYEAEGGRMVQSAATGEWLEIGDITYDGVRRIMSGLEDRS